MRMPCHIVSTAVAIAAVGWSTLPAVSQTTGSRSTDKTLVAWVSLADGDYSGGSVLTLQREEVFDAIVFGEIKEKTWMAGSNNFERTNHQQDYAPEKTGKGQLVQIAIVYAGDQITIFRNGQQLTRYRAENTDLLEGDEQAVVFGVRHLDGGDGDIHGELDDARIYARALTAEEITSLKPNQMSSIAPWAWWDFTGDELRERTGRFTHAEMGGGAEVADGRLKLDEGAVVVATRTEENMDWARWAHRALVNLKDYQPDTPAMPADVPDSWYTYHLAHPGPGRAEPGDPNAAVYYHGRYHLHYIYRTRYGFCFAHVSSDDMVHWRWHQTALAPPVTGHGMFSGTAFFTKEGVPAIIYHGEGSDRNWIVYGQDDNLEQWSDPRPVVPQLPDGSEADCTNWDPDCWLRNGTYYAISGGRPPELMKSDDLKRWEFLGRLFHNNTDWDALGLDPNEDVSCANMFPIGDKWMLLCISHELGCRYYLGDFKGNKYLPETHFLMNWARTDYFAPESLLTPDGRRVMWAWITDELLSSQTGVQSLPRELSLPDDGVLRMRPLRELKNLRHAEQDEGNVKLSAGESYSLKKIAGDTLELSVVFQPTKARAYGVRVFCGDDGEGVPIRYLADEEKLLVGNVQAPFELQEREGLQLTIFLDKDLVDVFANDRQAITTGVETGFQHAGIEVFSEDGPLSATVKGWQMRSVY